MPDISVLLEVTHEAAVTFTAWPVGDAAPFSFLRLHGGMSMPDVGSAVATMASGEDAEGDAAVTVAALVESDGLYLPGGVRVADPGGGPALAPGCCSGLEYWREWEAAESGEQVWQGHDPWAWAQRDGDRLHLVPDGPDAARAHGFHLPLSALPLITARVRADLTGFTTAVRAWADTTVPDLAGALAARLTRELGLGV